MIVPKVPPNEAARLASLYACDVLDTEPEWAFDDLTELAASICEAPISLISLVDADRQWFKSHHGLEATQTPRDIAFCAHAILQSDPLIVSDSRMDSRFDDNPLTLGPTDVRFYAGAQLIKPEGYALGTLCIIDHRPRELTDFQKTCLQRLARQASNLLEARRLRELAQSAVHAKSEFLATMSHELRTPLNGVIGMLNCLLDTPLSKEQRDFAATADKSAQHLLMMVSEILDFSRLATGHIELESVSTNIRELTADVVAAGAEEARTKGVTLNFEWQSKRSPLRFTDSIRVRQILFNLISNALKFTRNGSIQVRVRDVEDGDADSAELEFDIVDTGIGIAPKALSTIFDHFMQADNSTTRRFGGVGLGLATTKKLVDLFSGTLGVASEVGKGSHFFFKLKLPLDVPRTDSNQGDAHKFKGDSNRRLNVLVAEDDSINQTVITILLEKLGHSMTLVANGRAAVEACAKFQFDVVLMDCMMPVMDGYEASTAIRASETLWAKSIPIIAVTGNSLEGDWRLCQKAGMSDYLPKPFKLQRLKEVIQQSVEKQQGSFQNVH